MPIYEYKCSECDFHIETMQKVTDEPLRNCEKCGGAMVKQWSLSGFQFKGEGWYVTDYASKKNDKPAEKPDSAAKTESTKAAEPASKPANDKSSASEKETVSKKE